MQISYLGRIPFAEGVRRQAEGPCPSVFGFESEPTVSLGVRAGISEDLLRSEADWQQAGFTIFHADRGGQATLHLPGQLICFVSQDVRATGIKSYICLLQKATQAFLARNGLTSTWRNEEPGLYSAIGKVMSLGLRVRAGRTFHGLAINVHNDLTPYAGIRVCGRAGAAIDRLKTEKSLENLFQEWTEEYMALLTSRPSSHNLEPVQSVRL